MNLDEAYLQTRRQLRAVVSLPEHILDVAQEYFDAERGSAAEGDLLKQIKTTGRIRPRF